MGFTTIYEFLGSLIENTHKCSPVKDAEGFFKRLASRGRHRPIAKAWAGLPNREHILWVAPTASLPGEFLQFPLRVGSIQTQSLSVSLSPPVDK